MAKINKTIGEVDCTVIYKTVPELCRETGASKSSVHFHVNRGTIDAISVEGHRHNLFVDPDNCAKFKSLVSAGIIRTKKEVS